MLTPIGARRVLLAAALGSALFTLLSLLSSLAAREGGLYAYDWRVYFLAAGEMLGGASPYAATMFGPTDPVYLYPPVLAALLIPLLPLGLALSSALAITGGVIVPAWLLLRERLRPDTLLAGLPTQGTARIVSLLGLGVAIGALALWWLPARSGAAEGSATILLGLLIAAGASALTQHPRRAGLLFGLAIAIKLTPALLLPVLLARGAWRTVASALLTVAGLSLLSLLAPGGLAAWIDLPGSLTQTAQAAFGGYGDPSVSERVARGLANNAAPLALLVRVELLSSETAITLARLLPLLAVPLAVLLDRWVGGGRRGLLLAAALSLLVVPTLWPHASLLLLPLAAPGLMRASLPLPGGRRLSAPWTGLLLCVAPVYLVALSVPSATIAALAGMSLAGRWLPDERSDRLTGAAADRGSEG